jgi:hypothetical protein
LSDYKAYIGFVNREDLVRRAIESSAEVLPDLTVIDNSENGISFDPGCRVFRPPMPIWFVHCVNFALLDARRQGASMCLWLHSDAWAPEGAYTKLIETVRQFTSEGRKWGVVFTSYDALVALNTAMLDDVGLFDQNLSWYHGDQDYYRRVTLAGYECIDTAIEVNHEYSMTIRSDPKIGFLNSIMHPLGSQYYVQKWGGPCGEEKHTVPFGRPDLFQDARLGGS